MEAMVADREAEMVEWNDGRLDEKFQAIDQRFDQLDKKIDEGFVRMDAGFTRIDRRFEQLDSRFEGLHRMLFQAAWALVIGLLTLVGVLIGLVVT
jgi:hypothetical protein